MSGSLTDSRYYVNKVHAKQVKCWYIVVIWEMTICFTVCLRTK